MTSERIEKILSAAAIMRNLRCDSDTHFVLTRVAEQLEVKVSVEIPGATTLNRTVKALVNANRDLLIEADLPENWKIRRVLLVAHSLLMP